MRWSGSGGGERWRELIGYKLMMGAKNTSFKWNEHKLNVCNREWEQRAERERERETELDRAIKDVNV